MPSISPFRWAVLFALAVPFSGAVAAAAAVAPAKVQQVSISNFVFSPQVITVTAGTTVVWTNADDDPHTVTANDKSFHSTAMDTSERFSFTFTRPGEFAYFCSLHPHMTGKVVVKG